MTALPAVAIQTAPKPSSKKALATAQSEAAAARLTVKDQIEQTRATLSELDAQRAAALVALAEGRPDADPLDVVKIEATAAALRLRLETLTGQAETARRAEWLATYRLECATAGDLAKAEAVARRERDKAEAAFVEADRLYRRTATQAHIAAMTVLAPVGLTAQDARLLALPMLQARLDGGLLDAAEYTALAANAEKAEARLIAAESAGRS